MVLDKPAWILLEMDWQTYKNLPWKKKKALLKTLGVKFEKVDWKKIKAEEPPGGYLLQAFIRENAVRRDLEDKFPNLKINKVFDW